MFRAIDWRGMLVPDVSLIEIILRGTVMYLGLFVLLRVILKRQSGGLATTDILLVVLLGDASQNGMTGESFALPNALVLVATLIGWDYFFDWLGYHSEWFTRLTQSPPTPLVREGRVMRENLRRELITMESLRGQLREQGIEDLADVKLACMEGDGHISVIKRQADSDSPHPRKERAK